MDNKKLVKAEECIEAALSHLKLDGDMVLIESGLHERSGTDYDPQVAPFTHRTTVRKCIETLYDPRHGYDSVIIVADGLDGKEGSIEALSYAMGEYYSDNADVFNFNLHTEEGYKEYKATLERQKIESMLQHTASTLSIPLDSLDMIEYLRNRLHAARELQSEFNSGEQMMERMGACVASLGSARGAEVFHEDQNFENDRSGGIVKLYGDMLFWIRTYCPLLYAEHEEKERRERLKS